MNDEEFFDLIYSQWAKTTGAEDTYWMSEKDEDVEGVWHLWSVAQDQMKTWVGDINAEVDADFITAIHGCMPDLVRRLHDALDEADRLDTARDEREQQIGRLAVENMELREECARLEETIATARSKAADVLWKIERPM